MAQPTFFLQPLAAAISLACFSSVVFAAEADSAHILAPIVVTAQQGNDANGLILYADPNNPFSLFLQQMAQIIYKVFRVLVQLKAVEPTM
jgi:hypothetical protein